MRLPDSAWIVRSEHVNPIFPGRENTCIWCKSTLGQIHEQTCVVRQRSVIVKIEITMLRMIPESFNPDQVEFRMNGSSWCASNIISELDTMFGGEGRCLCPYFNGEYVREATAEDEEDYGRSVRDTLYEDGIIGIVNSSIEGAKE